MSLNTELKATQYVVMHDDFDAELHSVWGPFTQDEAKAFIAGQEGLVIRELARPDWSELHPTQIAKGCVQDDCKMPLNTL